MTGYQEAVSDPSYAGQIITFTYPMIGNYGVAAAAMESDRVQSRAVIMREAKNGETLPMPRAAGSTGSSLRSPGHSRGRHARARSPHPRPRRDARRTSPPSSIRPRRAGAVASEPSMSGADLARTVTPESPVEIAGGGPHVVAIDTGIKLSIVRQLLSAIAG